MANHKSSEKRARQTRVYKTRIKNVTKNVLAAIDTADKEKAVDAMKTANKYLHHCVSKGILRKETAARRVSRLQVKVNAI
jgi:small subunit ribosomal protein S20